MGLPFLEAVILNQFDLRVLEDEHDQGDRRRLQFRDAVAVRCETQFEDWFNFDGCITKGFLKSIPQRFNSYDQVDVSNLAKVKQIARRIIQNEHDVRKNPKHQSGQHVVALAATTYSVCVAVQPLCVLALMCRGFFDIWKPSVSSRRIPGSCRVRIMRNSTQPLAPQHVSGALEVQVRVHPESAVPVQHAPTHSRHARAVLEPCHGDPWLSAPLRRRGAHVVPSCGLHTTLLVPEWTSAVLNPVLTIGALSRLLLSYGSCLLVYDTTSFSL